MTAKTLRIALFALVLLLTRTSAARAQVEIRASDDVKFKLGILGQFQADTVQTEPDNVSSNNLFARRLRVIFGGQVAKNITFFVDTDTPNLGKTVATGKNVQPTTIVQDAYGEFKPSEAFALGAGLMYAPFSRNSIQSSAKLLPIDSGRYTFSQSAPTQSSSGRDTGFQARGYFLADHLEYRVGAFQGVRDTLSHNGFRYVGRLQYNFLDTETEFTYTGTSLGEKRIFGVGAAFDTQEQYRGYDADVFADLPVGPGAVTMQFDYNRFDGGITLPTLKKQHVVLAELGYLIAPLNLTPVVQFSNRNVVDTGTTIGDERHWSVGLNYWLAGHNANVKGAYSRVSPTRSRAQNEFTIQLQLYYF